MEEFLEKKEILHTRDERGKLLPLKVKLELLEGDKYVMVTPMPRGELQRVYTDNVGGKGGEEQESNIIKDHLHKPELTEDEIRALKPNYANAIITAIVSISTGMDQDEVRSLGNQKSAEMAEDYLKKKP